VRDSTRSALRFWAVAGMVYAALLAFIATVCVPWKTPAANAAILAYAALHAAGGIGMILRPRLGHRLAVTGGAVGLLSAIAVCAALLASFTYLKDVYGDFGLGASVGSLLFASAALQLLGLYPALLLRAMLRREVREDLGIGAGIVRAIFGALLAIPALPVGVHTLFAFDPVPPVPQEGRDLVVSRLRAAVDGTRPDRPIAGLDGIPVGAGPLTVTLWRGGGRVARVVGDGEDLAGAVEAAARSLAREANGRGGPGSGGTIKVDRIVAASPVPSEVGPILAISVNPGVDGLRRGRGSDAVILMPDDLVRAQLFGAAPLVPGIRELRLGLDAKAALARLPGEGRIERIRVESWVESPEGALPCLRGNTPPPAEGPEAWRAAAIAGGEFILRQIRDDGRFHYRYRPLTHRHPGGGDYSLPRHAGTIYSLALLYGHTRDGRFEAGARRAISWLEGRIPERCGQKGMACIPEGNEAWLGSTALTVVGMLEYQRRTGDARYEGTARGLLAFIMHLQRDDGDFAHLYRIDEDRVDDGPRSMFFSEEAALALVMADEVLGDDRYLAAARRALDYLTGPKYDYFLGRFIYGADHWTCIAAHEAWPRLRSPAYLEFCRGYARFMGRLQDGAGEWESEDFAGHYGFGAFMVPQAPAAAGFTEAIISTYELSRLHGVPDEALRRQAALALDALARDQIRKGNSWMMRRPEYAAGGIRRSLVEQEVRIDFTQHAASALIRGAAM